MVAKKLREGVPFPAEDTRERDTDVPEKCIQVVRKPLIKMYKKKEHVTIETLYNKLSERVNTSKNGWKWSQSTLYRFITTKMGYSYTMQKSYYEQLKEDVEIANQRMKYIKKIQYYRKKGRNFLSR